MTDNPDFGLVVEVSADLWAQKKRRVAFLEAVLVQVLRDQTRIREWFTATELAALCLPGIPHSPQGVGQHAKAKSWLQALTKRHGRVYTAYHYSSLPNPAFEAFIKRLIDLPSDAELIPDTASQPCQSAVATPQWMLPLMRIIRTGHAPTWQDARAALIHALPSGVDMPTQVELKTAFDRLRG